MFAEHSQELTSRKIALRRANAEDGQFLFRVYTSTREEEIAALGWDAPKTQSFLRMQFEVRQRAYRAAYPAAETMVIEIEDVAAGSMIVFRGTNEIRLVDIALLPDSRGRGHGEALLRELIVEAAISRLALKLSVLRSSRAARLYERLGFVAAGGDAVYCEMEFRPAQHAEATSAAKT